MIPYGRQSIDSDDIKNVVKVLRSDYLTQGPEILKFEKALAKYCGVKYAVAAASGTAALHLAYLVAGLKAGDEVITTPNTFVATANMIIACGAKPVFCDIRPDTCNIDENKIEKMITRKTKAIVPVHFAGHPCEMDKILKIARKHELLVIEDAAHALGASYKGKKIGGLRSDMTIFSFHPVKSITTGEGGAILTDSRRFYKKLVLLRSHGVVKAKDGFNVMKEFGYNYRLTDIQAALGISQLKRLNQFIKQRQKITKWYKKALGNLKDITLSTEIKGAKSSWHLYVIKVKEIKNRLPLYRFLIKNGIKVNFHYPVVYKHPYYQKNVAGKNNCRLAELYEKKAITLPLYPLLTKAEVKFISDKVKTFFKDK